MADATMVLSWLGTAGALGAALYARKQAIAALDAVAESRRQTMIAEAAAQESVRQSEAAQRSATASEEANRMAQSFIRFEVQQASETSGGYVFTNKGNCSASQVVLKCKNGDRHWVDGEPLTLEPGAGSPAVRIGAANWPVTVTFAEPPGSAEVAKPPRPSGAAGFPG